MSLTPDDARFLNRFQSLRIPLNEWTHHDHLRLAWICLRTSAFDDAVQRIRTGIQAHNAHHGIRSTPDGGYHDTLTIAWVHLVQAVMQAAPPAPDSRSFIAANPDLHDKWLILKYYSRPCLRTPEARKSFVRPDLKPLPSRASE